MARSAAAIVAGVVTNVVLSMATDGLLRAVGVFPSGGGQMSSGLFAVATAYRVLFGGISGYVAARLAPERPIGHAVLLGAVGFALSMMGAMATWNAGQEFGPKWYPIALVVTAIPSALAGGVFAARRGRDADAVVRD
jgi:hypothetical protein